MAQTTFTTNNALTKKHWDEKLFRETEKESFFTQSGFEGTGSDSLVHVKTQTEKGPGDQIKFGLAHRLTSEFIVGESTQAENNEEALDTSDDSVTLELYRLAVRDNGALTRKRAMFSIDEESKTRLKNRAVEAIDQLKFDALFASPTRIMYKTSTGLLQTATANTAQAAMDATHSKLTPQMVSAMKVYAKTGGDRSFNPIRPVKYKGKDYFKMLVHPDVGYDLKTNSVFMSAWENARERGDDNPLFRNALLVWDGVIIHEHENCPIATDGGGASVAWSKAVFMGAQSLVWAWGMRPWTVQETFDYGNQHGYCWHMIGKAKKPQFDSEDFGSLGVYLARTNVSGI